MIEINVGQQPNDGTGDTLRTSFIKTNNNFDYLERRRSYEIKYSPYVYDGDSALYIINELLTNFEQLPTGNYGFKIKYQTQESDENYINAEFGTSFTAHIRSSGNRNNTHLTQHTATALISNEDYAPGLGTYDIGTGFSNLSNLRATYTIPGNKLVVNGKTTGYQGSGYWSVVIKENGDLEANLDTNDNTFYCSDTNRIIGFCRDMSNAKPTFFYSDNLDGDNINYLNLIDIQTQYGIGNFTIGALHYTPGVGYLVHYCTPFTLNYQGTLLLDFNFNVKRSSVGNFGYTTVQMTSHEFSTMMKPNNDFLISLGNTLLIFKANGSIDTLTFSLLFGASFGGSPYFYYDIDTDKIYMCITEGGGTVPKAAIRFNSNYTIDNTFNTTVGAGFQSEHIKFYKNENGDVRILLRYFNTSDGTSKYGVIRLLDDGSIDPTFNQFLVNPFNSQEIRSILIKDNHIHIWTQDQASGFPFYTKTDIDGFNREDVNVAVNFVVSNAMPSLAVDDEGRFYYVGNFSLVNDIPAMGLVRYVKINDEWIIDNVSTIEQAKWIFKSTLTFGSGFDYRLYSDDEHLYLEVANTEGKIPQFINITMEIQKTIGGSSGNNETYT